MSIIEQFQAKEMRKKNCQKRMQYNAFTIIIFMYRTSLREKYLSKIEHLIHSRYIILVKFSLKKHLLFYL